MINVILFCAIVYVLVKVLSILLFKIKIPNSKLECDSVHTWVYGDDGYLICKMCNKRPGVENERDE